MEVEELQERWMHEALFLSVGNEYLTDVLLTYPEIS